MRRPLRLLIPLLMATLACSTVTNFFTIPGPEDLATDAVGVPSRTPVAATKAPAATRTPAQPAASLTPPATPEALPFTLDEADDAQAALLPADAADAAALPAATRYVIDVAVGVDGTRSAAYSGREAIRYTNRESAPLATLVLMLWPNYREQYVGGLTLGRVTVGGAEVKPEIFNGGLAARVALAQPLAPGASIDLEAEFSGHAEDSGGNLARFGLTQGVLLAPTFYPLIPRIVNGEWQTVRPPDGGDTTNSDTSFYAWRVTAPVGLAVAASGVIASQEKTGDTQTQTLFSGPMRDIALVVGPLQLTQRTLADGVVLNVWVLAEHKDEAAALLDQAGTQEENLDNLVGAYPFAELDVVDAPGAYGGVEYPGLVFIGVVDAFRGYEEATVHEVGHQWFYSLIGDDQLTQPWLDEAAASYTEVLYQEKTGGPQAAADAVENFRGYLNAASDPDLPVGRGVGDYPGPSDYGAIVYGKGALFFDALRRQLGDETFFKFLHNYYAKYRYGFADSAGFEATAEETCGCDLKGLFDEWVFGPQ
ncbi:MAG: M1 family metallopeptidase [Anaerolineales bacterium]